MEHIGYKIVSFNEAEEFYSLNEAENVSPQIGKIEEMPKTGMFLTPSRIFCIDYYSGLSDDEDVILKYKYDSKDVISGDLDIPESEIIVSKARLVSAQNLSDPNKDMSPFVGSRADNISNETPGILEPGRTLVVVDVQPEYCKGWKKTEALMEAINAHDGPVIMMINSEESGCSQDTLQDCYYFWYENGLEEDVADRLKVVDKGYSHLRGWMDEGVDEDIIVKFLQYMQSEKISTTQDMDEDIIEELAGDYFKKVMLVNSIFDGWLDPKLIKSLDGAIMCGGGAEECLREVELMLRSHGIKYDLLPEFVYDGNTDMESKISSSYRY